MNKEYTPLRDKEIVKCNCEINERKNYIEVTPKGEITLYNGPDLYKKLNNLVEKDKHIVIDASQIKYCCSAGAAILVEELQKEEGKNKVLVLHSAPKELMESLEVLKLENVFEIYNNRHEAIDSLRCDNIIYFPKNNSLEQFLEN